MRLMSVYFKIEKALKIALGGGCHNPINTDIVTDTHNSGHKLGFH